MKQPYSTNWTGVPHTDKRAHVIGTEAVKNAHVVRLTKASIRCAIIENAHFEVADVNDIYSTYGGNQRVEVQCLWYGKKPPNTWMHLTHLGECEEVRQFSGEVVCNIGRTKSASRR